MKWRFFYWIEQAYPLPPQALALVRMFYASYLLFFALDRTDWISAYPDVFFIPPPSMTAFFPGIPHEIFFHLLNGLAVFSLVALLLGYRTRAASLTFFLVLLTYTSFAHSFGKINHLVLFLFFPLVMAGSGWGDGLSMDAAIRRRREGKGPEGSLGKRGQATSLEAVASEEVNPECQTGEGGNVEEDYNPGSASEAIYPVEAAKESEIPIKSIESVEAAKESEIPIKSIESVEAAKESEETVDENNINIEDNALWVAPEPEEPDHLSVKLPPAKTWTVTLMSILIGFTMFTAGMSKLLSGWTDVGTQAIHSLILETVYFNGHTDLLAMPLLNFESPMFWEIVDWLVLFFELGMLPAVFSPRIFRLWVSFSVLFHFGVLLAMNIDFSIHLPVYALFLPWGQIFKMTGGRRKKLEAALDRICNWLRPWMLVPLSALFLWIMYTGGNLFQMTMSLFGSPPDWLNGFVLFCLASAISLYFWVFNHPR